MHNDQVLLLNLDFVKENVILHNYTHQVKQQASLKQVSSHLNTQLPEVYTKESSYFSISPQIWKGKRAFKQLQLWTTILDSHNVDREEGRMVAEITQVLQLSFNWLNW